MEAKFIRDGKKIIDLSLESDDPARVQAFDSVNKAKKKSREIQQANGGLGRGSLRARPAA